MDFTFFSAANAVLFVRDDAELARWTVEDYALTAEFPYDADKVIERGQRIGFTDETGVFQPFEIRKVENMEPDHYQRITAEHIVISELSDEHIYKSEITDTAIGTALETILTNTLWTVGTIGDLTVQSADISTGSVWQAVRTLENNYNVYITPRVTFDGTGITGRYLDITTAGGTWNGLLLSFNKNADEIGVTYDDTEVITAMYGYGKLDDDEPLTFADVVWAETAEHPAKPANQTYLVNPAALSAYGRNGRNRWGYYQNSNITDDDVLLEKTWLALQQASQPTICIDCAVCDLYRLGYADQPIRLHDIVMVHVLPIGVDVQLEITRLAVDLLDPTVTRPTIGTYIPNIVYINRQTASRSGGGGGGGGRGQTNAEYEISEFETEILANQYEISLRAYQRDMSNVEEILTESGVAITSGGTIIYANNNLDDMQSAITTNANKIGLVVQGTGSNASIKAASIVAAINDAASTVTISADHIVLDGDAVATALAAKDLQVYRVRADRLSASDYLTLGSGGVLTLWNSTWTSQSLKAGSASGLSSHNVLTTGGADIELDHYHAITVSEANGVVTITQGAVSATAGSGTFNIADTAFYQSAVSAAQSTGWADAAGAIVWPSAGQTSSMAITYPDSTYGDTLTANFHMIAGVWNNNTLPVRLYATGSATGAVAELDVTGPTISLSSSSWTTTSRSIGYVSGTLDMTLSNGQSLSRTVTDIRAPHARAARVLSSGNIRVFYSNITSGNDYEDVQEI